MIINMSNILKIKKKNSFYDFIIQNPKKSQHAYKS